MVKHARPLYTFAAGRFADDWQITVTARLPDGNVVAVSLPVMPPVLETIRAEPAEGLPEFAPNAAGWGKGFALPGIRAQECTARFALDPDTLRVCAGPGPDALTFERGRDFEMDTEWGTVGRLATGRIAPEQRVYLSYHYGLTRLDSVVLGNKGVLRLVEGTPHIATPHPPALAPGERRLANLLLEARLDALDDAHIFPVLEQAYPDPPPSSPSVAETHLPETFDKLTRGRSLHILAWGDSVTDGGYLPGGEKDRWQNQFVERLRGFFPTADITLTTEAWGGRNTASYLAEPPGALHNYREKVLAAQADLIISEFVNDAYLTPAQVHERYAGFLADFQQIGAEWIILTPHYVRPDWMGLSGQREIENDPRPYVHGLREFAERNHVALADAALRWGRLWRQGIPYSTLLHNTINHPDIRGMRIFVDSLMGIFASSRSGEAG